MALRLFRKVVNFQFDADGDILLLLLCSSDDGLARFQVSSSALCLASPVFRAMVGAKGKFKESKRLQERKSGEQPMEITLKDDNPKALAVILSIIHHQHDSVPESLPEENLWQIAILIDKYDLREVTKLWTNVWVQPYVGFAGLPLASSFYFNGDRGVFLAYAFCREMIFRSISKNIILTWRCDPDQHLLYPSGFLATSRVRFEFVPQPIVGIYIFLWFSLILAYKTLEELYQSREAYVKEMFNCISRYISLYSDSQRAQCSWGDGAMTCGSIIHQGLIQKFQLSTDPDTLPIYYSMEETRATLAKIKSFGYVFFDNT